jgi:hypothetical protein
MKNVQYFCCLSLYGVLLAPYFFYDVHEHVDRERNCNGVEGEHHDDVPLEEVQHDHCELQKYQHVRAHQQQYLKLSRPSREPELELEKSKYRAY